MSFVTKIATSMNTNQKEFEAGDIIVFKQDDDYWKLEGIVKSPLPTSVLFVRSAQWNGCTIVNGENTFRLFIYKHEYCRFLMISRVADAI